MNSNSLFDLVLSQPFSVISKIYGYHSGVEAQAQWACKAIFQSLSELSKIIVMRLLFVDSSFTTEDIENWIKPEGLLSFRCSIDQLKSLYIFVLSADDAQTSHSKSPNLLLNSSFRTNFIAGISNTSEPWSNASDTVNNDTILHNISLEFLYTHCTEKWEAMLNYLVNSGRIKSTYGVVTHATISPIVRNFLLYASLLSVDPSAANNGGKEQWLLITRKGYEFMLMDRHDQVCNFIMASLSRSENQHEILSLLFMISYCEYGRGYPLRALTPNQRQLLYEFSFLGVVYIASTTAVDFYPTPTLIDIMFSRTMRNANLAEAAAGQLVPAMGPQSLEKMTIIVETNCQVTAKIHNDLQFSLLLLFVEVSLRLPNMAIGQLTREKTKMAQRMGISAAQMIDFLTLHAHPITATSIIPGESTVAAAGDGPVNTHDCGIPGNVSDQLILWEKECTRLTAESVVVVDLKAWVLSRQKMLVQGFLPRAGHPSPALDDSVVDHGTSAFTKLVDFTTEQGFHVWSNKTKYLLAVHSESYSTVLSYFNDTFT